MTARHFVGIDLGTSNTVVASASEGAPCAVEAVLQRTSPSTLEALQLFASSAFASLPGEVEPSEALLETDGWVLGDFAKRRGAEVPERLVSSSKSWLCHPRVDKNAPILPWGADDVPKLSPVEVAAKVLAQVRHSWDSSHPGAPLAAQQVVLTVPASFDEVARELTLAAAQRAGLDVRLLEEPQAAFYDAMARGEIDRLAERMRADGRQTAQVLVCDLGGGTTDLSLLGVTLTGGEPEVRRLAVGNHLLLGGDNMDLALAHLLEPRMAGEGEKLEPREFTSLVYAARRAKETLLSKGGPEEHKITLLGRGSNLLGSAKRATLTRDEATRVVIDGFLPLVERDELPARARAGLVALGLPYERDVAITRHIAAFVARHVAEGTRVDALLLNGGVFRAEKIRDAVKQAVAHLQAGAAPLELAMDDPDTAVARGAAIFARALAENGKRISGGAARSYFIRVGKSERGRPLAVCAIPKGSEEGVRQCATETRLKLLVGKPARFELYSSDKMAPATGAVVEIDDGELDALPPLVTVVPADTGRGELDVVLEAELTPVGTLEISCVEAAATGVPRRFRLAFDLRPKSSESIPPVASTRRAADRGIDEALATITQLYGKGTESEARDAKNLQRELERLLGDRDAWSADTSRALADRLIEHLKGRKRSLDHERVFFQLTGYCLRPGFGAPGDDQRCAKMAPLFGERLAFPKEARSWQQLFICFRRIAAGLSEADQLAMRNDLDPFIAPSELKLKKPKTFKPESSDYEILELCAHLEHVPPARRADLGSWILERTWTKRDPRLWAAIGRLGARVPAYASAHRVTSPLVAEKWLEQLLADKWADLASAPRAASDMARLTGDRARDVSPSMRERVAARLQKEGADSALVRAVREVVEVVRDERATFFGERLAPGLRL